MSCQEKFEKANGYKFNWNNYFNVKPLDLFEKQCKWNRDSLEDEIDNLVRCGSPQFLAEAAYEFVLDKFVLALYDRIDWDELAKEVLVNHNGGNRACIFADGTIVTLQNNEYFSDSTEHVATILTQGVGEMDTSYFCEGFVKYDEDKGAYEVGTIFDVILEYIQEGDMSCFLDDWRDEIEREIKGER